MSRAQSRLSLISRHLDTRLPLKINTPYSAEREAARSKDSDISPRPPRRPPKKPPSSSRPPRDSKMSSSSTQAAHPTLLIPGPIEFDDAVLESMSHYSESHVSAPFISTFSSTLSLLRKLFQTTNPASQPFIVSGSGTLGWDMVSSNLLEQGDSVLVLHTGYFGDSFADCLRVYGANPIQLKARIGSRPSLSEVEQALQEKPYKMITITHVDTSTGVLSDVKALAELVHRVSPETLVVVDGVCSVGSEEIKFDEWGLDVVLTASQKGIGCPAGLSILMVSERGVKRFEERTSPPTSYYASWGNWLPIMKNYELKKPSYFATPSPQLIHALETSLRQILSFPLETRWEAHRTASSKVKHAINELGLKQLAENPEMQANGMTAFWLPDGITPGDVLPKLLEQGGVVLAGGLHKEIAGRYLRVGHMGISVTDPKRDDIEKVLKAIRKVFGEIMNNGTGGTGNENRKGGTGNGNGNDTLNDRMADGSTTGTSTSTSTTGGAMK
ncbi:MAG: hypothetical protein M1823_001318 [Watsoniomyces obsoletus]|nr:MAG: hypothetical protein M1823_001318 [Watsoniomyces obsoletus]